jgi:vitamin B12 transporter
MALASSTLRAQAGDAGASGAANNVEGAADVTDAEVATDAGGDAEAELQPPPALDHVDAAPELPPSSPPVDAARELEASAPEALPPAALPVPVPPPPEVTEVTVRVQGDVERMRRSAEAIKVVELRNARRESADLGEVLARTPGVGVRRSGGLGSSARFSLNGFTDDQIRFFLDGVPLEFAGFPFGFANIPVNLFERVEIYSGVVPVRFGADALGGAVNLVTPQPRSGPHAAASYQAGSYGEHRATLTGQLLHEPSGFYVGVGGFLDAALNDYPIDVEVANAVGRPEPARVHRFHDAYQARGAQLETGWLRRPWAERLLLRAFIAETDQEIQHNAFMTVPYGGVTFDSRTLGGNLRYEGKLGNAWRLDTVTGYTYTQAHLLDVDHCAYDWFGRCLVQRRQGGEIEPGNPRDTLTWEHAVYSRTSFDWELVPKHHLLLAISPTFVTRTGDDREQIEPDARDPLEAERSLLTAVNGLEYLLFAFGDRLENRAFVKQYLQLAQAYEEVADAVSVHRERRTHRYGLGDALRYRFTDWLYAKTSYEWATRLPRAEEVFGDNRLLKPYLELKPEESHNLNLGAVLSLDARSGAWRGELNSFYRKPDQLIVRLADDVFQFYRNVYSARSLGLEASAGWTAPGKWLVLDVNGTYQSFRNTATEGPFSPYRGDRIPNRPWLFANAALRLQKQGMFTARDKIALFSYLRYVHEFYRSWESVGQVQYKQTVSGYLLPSIGAIYDVSSERAKFSSSIEVLNLTDVRVEDFYGVQRPGRTLHAKMTIDY